MSFGEKLKGIFKGNKNTEKEIENEVLEGSVIDECVFSESEAETSLLSMEEEETSLLNSSGFHYSVPEFPESHNSEPFLNDTEGETTLLSHFESNESSIDDTVSQFAELQATVYMSGDSSENETTLLKETPVFDVTNDKSYDPGDSRLYLVNSKTGEKILIGITPFTIGKDPSNFLVVNNETVSRKHAIITCENGTFFVTDCNSTNGTVIEGITLQPNERAEIENGYMISFGSESYQTLMERG